MNAQRGGRELHLLELAGRVDLDGDGDGLLRRTFQAQRLSGVGRAAGRLRRQRARERIRVVLKHDHARQRIERIEADDGALLDLGRAGESAHGVVRRSICFR
jgi:hypothetical protein